MQESQQSSDRAASRGPLTGVRIVEFTGIGPVPFAAMLLADMGAEVVRIERVGGQAPLPKIIDRGRRIVELDLKDPKAVAKVLDLLAGADALLEGFRPGVMERLGLGPDVVLKRNPRLAYGRMTGWGQDGPLALAAGHDINYIAITGALAAIGPRQGPPSPPLNLIGDYGGGALYLAMGVLAAVLSARSTGLGQVVDCAMCDGAASLMSAFFELRSQGEWTETREDNIVDGGAPFYGAFECSDGLYISLAPMEPLFYEHFCRALGLTKEEAVLRDDKKSWPKLRARVRDIVRQHSRDEWCKRLEGSDVCFGPVLTMAEAPRHAHLAARGTFVERNGIVQPGPAPRFSSTPSQLRESVLETSIDDVAAGWRR